MSGALARDELAILERQIGADAYRRTMAALPADARSEIVGLTAVGWIDVEIIKSVFVTAARETGREPERVHRDAIYAGMEQTFRSVWRLILRVTTDNALVTRTPLVYAKSFDTGTLRARITSPGRAELLLDGWPNGEEFSLRGVAIGVEATLKLAGRKNVKVSHYRTADGAKYLASWDV
jgi:hypothetical protein